MLRLTRSRPHPATDSPSRVGMIRAARKLDPLALEVEPGIACAPGALGAERLTMPRTVTNTKSHSRAPQKGEGPRQVSLAGPIKSAMTYFPAEQYHRQQGLHFCVRDGNRCFPLLIVTDKSGRGLSAATG